MVQRDDRRSRRQESATGAVRVGRRWGPAGTAGDARLRPGRGARVAGGGRPPAPPHRPTDVERGARAPAGSPPDACRHFPRHGARACPHRTARRPLAARPPHGDGGGGPAARHRREKNNNKIQARATASSDQPTWQRAAAGAASRLSRRRPCRCAADRPCRCGESARRRRSARAPPMGFMETVWVACRHPTAAPAAGRRRTRRDATHRRKKEPWRGNGAGASVPPPTASLTPLRRRAARRPNATVSVPCAPAGALAARR